MFVGDVLLMAKYTVDSGTFIVSDLTGRVVDGDGDQPDDAASMSGLVIIRRF